MPQASLEWRAAQSRQRCPEGAQGLRSASVKMDASTQLARFRRLVRGLQTSRRLSLLQRRPRRGGIGRFGVGRAGFPH